MAMLAIAACLLLVPRASHALTSSAQDTAATLVPNAPQSSEPDTNGVTDSEQTDVRVARLSNVEGTVQVFRGDQMEFPKAIENLPIPEGSRIATGADGRAEIEFEDGSVARLTPNSSLIIETLSTSANGTQESVLKQPSGLVYYELRSDSIALFTVQLEQGAIHPKVDSTFRVDLTSVPAALAVIDGDVQILGAADDSNAEAHQGQMIQFHPSATAQYAVLDGIIPNGFDDWNDQLDREAAKKAADQTSARNQQGDSVGSGVGYGWSDLDSYGGWYPLPGYGMVWQPYGVGADFDPYGFGSWADIDGFGISWISGYPWGWLPFHCGGWSYIDSFGWGWLPGGCGFGGGVGYGYGFGYGGGYGYYGRRPHHRPYTRIYRAPSGYRTPAPPTHWRTGIGIRNGQPGHNLVPIGKSAFTGRRMDGSRFRDARTVHFNGTKISPLRSDWSRGSTPVRNAALFDNAPSHAFRGGIRDRLQRPAAGLHETTAAIREEGGFRARRGALAGRESFGATHRDAFIHGGHFGQPAVFGSHGSFGEMRPGMQNGSAFRGMGRRSGFQNGVMSNGGFHTGSFRSGNVGGRVGFRGGDLSPSRGGFHGGSMGSRGSAGFQGGGFRGGSMGSGGGGGFHGGGGGFHGGGGGGHGR